MPETVTIAENSINSAYTGIARIVSIDGDFGFEYLEGLYVNGKAVKYETRGRNLLIPASCFETAGEYKVKAVLVNGTESNELSFTLNTPSTVTYAWTASNAETVTEVSDVSTAGTNHSRCNVAPLKVGTSGAEVIPPEGKTLDESLYVKWDLTGIAEGDYLIDTWLPGGWLAKELKAEVVSDGGATRKIYRSIQSAGPSGFVAYYTEAYFGNGDKIHLTGTGNEYIKIMLDDNYLYSSGRFMLVDSVRLTSWYDMNVVYDEFYGDEVITASDVRIVDEVGTDSEGNTATIKIAEADLSSKYAMNKHGYNAYLAVYNSDASLAGVISKSNVMIYDTDKEITLRFNLSQNGINPEGKTFRLFLWGGDADSANDTSLKPYIK